MKNIPVLRSTLGAVMPVKPRWVCHNQREQDLFEAWTNRQLDELDAGLAEKVNNENDAAYQVAVERVFSALAKKRAPLAKGRAVILAVKNKDENKLLQLIRDPKLARLVVREFTRKLPIGRGRKKGDSRPADINPFLRYVRMNAADDVKRIRSIWKQTFNKQNRTDDPTALGIAARRYGLAEDDLDNWRKNHH